MNWTNESLQVGHGNKIDDEMTKELISDSRSADKDACK